MSTHWRTGNLGEDAVHEVRCGVGHAPTAARRVDATPLAREGYEPLVINVRIVAGRKIDYRGNLIPYRP